MAENEPRDKAVPALPARDMDELLRFYARMGFRLAARYGEYGGDFAIVVRGDLELHFFGHPTVDPKENYAGCYLRVADVDALHRELVRAGVAKADGLADKPWGMRELAIVDPSGNLLRVGQRR